MKLLVNPHIIEIVKEPVNEREINISECEFEFSEEITQEYVKEAYFTLNGETYKQIIVNNKCDIPSEVLTKKGQVEIGVVAYLVENTRTLPFNPTYVKRFNPSPVFITTWAGSLKDNAENSEPITPSEMEQYEQALQDGLTEVNEKLDDIDQALEDVNTAITETNNLDLDVSKEGKVATVTLTKKDASTKVVTLSDGTNLMFNWQGTSLGIKTDEDADYTYVDLQGVQGETGPMGAPFTIKKTYSSVAEMNADFNNMQVGDYVMIASSVQIEDNAKLYTRGEQSWIFITDFSGATGIQGPTGATPNISIGTVTSGDTPSVTRTGTNENPVLNFVLEKGDKGDTGNTGPTGNGIASITKTGTSGLVDTYTITFTDGTTTTFDVTNGEVSQAQLDETNRMVEQAKLVYNALPKVSGSGTNITLDNTAETPLKLDLKGNTYQETTTGKQLFNVNGSLYSGSIDKVGNGFRLTNDGTYRNLSMNLPNSIPAGTYKVTYVMKNSTVADLTKSAISLRDNSSQLAIARPDISGEITLTIESPATKLYAYIGSSEESGATITFDDFMLSVEGGDFEPYTNGASPNPDYPQDIQVVTGNNTIKVEGKNLFNPNILLQENNYNTYDSTTGIWTTSSNGSYSRSILYNATGGTSNRNIAKLIHLLPNTKYTLKFYDMTNNTGVSNYLSYAFFDTNGVIIDGATTSSTAENTFTTPNQDCYLDIRRAHSSGTLSFSKIQLEISASATSYAPYVSQTYPINLPIKNYFNLQTQMSGDSDVTVQVIDNNNANVTYNGSSGNYKKIWYQISGLKINTNYTFKATITNSNSDVTNNWLNVRGSDSTSIYNKSYISNDVVTFNTGNYTTITIALYPVAGTSVANNTASYRNIQLEEGTKANQYWAYGTTPIELCKISNYQDYIYGTPDNWYKKQYIGKYIFDGTENWVSGQYGTNSWQLADKINVSYDTSKVQILSTIFRGISNNDRNTGGNNTIYTITSIAFYVRNTNITTKAEMQSTTNGTSICYILATPIDIQITEPTLVTQLNNLYYAYAYKDQTNINQSNSNLASIMNAETTRDLSNIFEL